ncbi:MAG: hypothetical protein AAF713_08905 [Pseudomonadota bacterium]
MSVKITARCHPALRALLPEPMPARRALPEWLRKMPNEAVSETLSGTTVRTFKQCPPILDAMALGIMIPLVCDLEVRGGEIVWDWEPPLIPDHNVSRAPVGMHSREQAEGAPFQPDGLVVKFTNFWTLEAPEGWQVLFTHPFNRPDLPFHTLTGLVDVDRFSDGYVHFPALWRDPDWEGVLPRGTPVAQAIPLPRQAVDVSAQTMTDDDAARVQALMLELKSGPGLYRKRFRLRPERQADPAA